MYTKNEVNDLLEATFKKFDVDRNESNKKIDEALKEFAERTHQNREECKELNKTLKIEMLELENRIERAFNRHLYTTISVLGGLIVVVGALATFAHAFFR